MQLKHFSEHEDVRTNFPRLLLYNQVKIALLSISICFMHSFTANRSCRTCTGLWGKTDKQLPKKGAAKRLL